MNNIFCINREIRERYTASWARKMTEARSDISQDPRSIYKCLDAWSREYIQAARATLRLIRIHAELGIITPIELGCELDTYRYMRQQAHAYLAARNNVYRETCAMAEKMQAFVKGGCKSSTCDVCGEPEFHGDRHHHDQDDYMLPSVGGGRHGREDFHAD